MAKKPIFNIKNDEAVQEETTAQPENTAKRFSRNMVGTFVDENGEWHVAQLKFDPSTGETTGYETRKTGHEIYEMEERLNIKLVQLGLFEEDYVNE